MKTKIFILVLICLFFLFCKDNPTTPDTPESNKANIVLDGQLQKTYTSYNCPQFEGYVKNIGEGTGYNCEVEITCYSDEAQTTIIDTARGHPANLEDIRPGERAYFAAVALSCSSHDEIKAISIKITWLDRSLF